MKKHIVLSLGAITVVAAGLGVSSVAGANGQGGGGQAPAACTATYAAIDLASRSASWGVYCPEGGNIFVDAQMFYDDDLVSLPDAGARYVAPGETWTVWSQDNTYSGFADHGVLHIVQEYGQTAPRVLAHIVK